MWLNRDKGKIDLENSLIVNDTAFTCVSVGNSYRYTPTQTLCNVYSNTPNKFINGVYQITKNQYIITPGAPLQENNFFTFAVEITPNTGFTTVPYNILIFDELTGQQLSFSAEIGVGTNSIMLDTINEPMNIGETKHITCKIICAVAFEFGININVGQEL